jgi:hypothetical protein
MRDRPGASPTANVRGSLGSHPEHCPRAMIAVASWRYSSARRASANARLVDAPNHRLIMRRLDGMGSAAWRHAYQLGPKYPAPPTVQVMAR